MGQRGFRRLDVPGTLARGFFGEELGQWRARARSEWQARATQGLRHDPRIAESLTGYFLDRFSFRLFAGAHHGRALGDRFTDDLETLSRSWTTRHEKLLHGLPELGIAPANFHEPIPQSPLLSELLLRWRSFLLDRGLPRIEGNFQESAVLRWGEFYQNSVLYPIYTPVHAGPGFFRRLSPEQQQDILRRHGASGVLALCTFLARTHEETHMLQFGEPLLCEYMLACLWCRFLTQEELWYWQRNARTGESLNIEAPWVLRVDLDRDEVISLFTDTHAGITSVCGSRAYEDLCLAAWLFDGRALRYREYLDIVTGYFEHRAQPSWQDAARERLEALLSTCAPARRLERAD